MYPQEFAYHRPKTVAEAVKLLSEVKDARVLAGGHSLLPAMKLRIASPAALVDIGRIAELSGIATRNGALQIGALTTHDAIASSGDVKRHCPVLAEAAAMIGDQQVRNRGTIGGSLAHADPAADFPTVMLLLGATVTAIGLNGSRKVAADQFFMDLFTTALKPGELLASIEIPACGPGTGAAYLKHRHPASSYAVVGVAALVEIRGGKCARVGLTIGGATPAPVRAKAAEAALTGQTANEDAIARAAEKVTEAIAEQLSDAYASAEYRKHLAAIMTRRALAKAVERCRGKSAE